MQDIDPETTNSRRREWILDLGGYVAVVIVCLALFAALYGTWRFDLNRIWTNRDYLFTAFQFQSMSETGWYTQHPRVGMPLGTNLYDFPLADGWHFLLIKAITLVVPLDAIQALNLHLILTFPLAALTAYFALRRLGCGRLISLAIAQLFTFTFFHADRIQHSFLAAYYLLPLMTLLLIRLSMEPGLLILRDAQTGRWRFDRSWATLGTLMTAVLMGAGGVYYAFFSCVFLVMVALVNGVGRRRWHAAVSCGIVVAVICATGAAVLWPTVRHSVEYQTKAKLKRTDPSHAELLGLRVTQMLLPPSGHPIKAWEQRRLDYVEHFPIHESVSASLGIVASLGFVWLLTLVFTRRPISGRPEEELSLANLNLTGLLLGVAGGIGPAIALYGFPEIRGYNRISIYLAFFALTAVGLGLQQLSERLANRRFANGLFALAVLALIPLGLRDQNPRSYRIQEPVAADIETARPFVQKLESSLPAGAMILQLPHRRFPESGHPHRMFDYDHFRGPLFSKSLRWSYGAMGDRAADRFLNELTAGPTSAMIESAASAGFDGIYIDRFGYPDAELELELEAWLGAPMEVCANGRLAFYDLRDIRRRIESETSPQELAAARESMFRRVGVMTEGCHPELKLDGESRLWTQRPQAAIHLINEQAHPTRMRIEMQLAASMGAGNIRVASGEIRHDVAVTETLSAPLGFEVTVPPGASTIRMTSDLKTNRRDPTWPTCFRISNLRITPAPTVGAATMNWRAEDE